MASWWGAGYERLAILRCHRTGRIMKTWRASVSALSEPSGDIDAYERRFRRIWLLAVVGLTRIFAGALAIVAVDLVRAWQTGSPNDWDSFKDSAFDALRISPLTLLASANVFDSHLGTVRLAFQVRQAAIGGDETLAPRSGVQPEPLAGDGLSALPTTIGPIRVPSGDRRAGLSAIVAVCAISALVIGLVALVVLLALPSDEFARMIGIVFAICAGVLFALTCLG
jgi:hypothetical protein